MENPTDMRKTSFQLQNSISQLQNQMTNLEQLLLQKEKFPSTPYLDSQTLYSIRELSDLLECSYYTAKRFQKLGIIKSTTYGRTITFFIPDIIAAIYTDERVGKYIKKMFPIYAGPRPKKFPEASISWELAYGRSMIVNLNYLKPIAASSDWYKKIELKSLVFNASIIQHQREPFISSNYKNHRNV